MLRNYSQLFLTVCLLALVGTSATRAVDLEPSQIERELHKVRFASAIPSDAGSPLLFATTESGSLEIKRKSPFKAFALSAMLPGAGQLYNGSKFKSLAFFGIEVAAWGLNFKWNGDGDDATDQFRQLQLDHWSRSDYEQKYLFAAYGVTDDHDAPYTEVSHHLPDDQTQQYFEMTGKYNQFAWGWSDAVREGQGLAYWETQGSNMRITGEATTPYSALRFEYENMRHDANQKHDRARKMVIVSIVNRLVSGFEAYMSAKKKNQHTIAADPAFAGLQMRASLKSYHAKQDTPWVTFSYKF